MLTLLRQTANQRNEHALSIHVVDEYTRKGSPIPGSEENLWILHGVPWLPYGELA